MKRAGNLYHLIADPDNLRLAFWKAVKGKRDRQEVIDFQARFDSALDQLRHELLGRNPSIGHYRFFHVHDPKKRLICAAAFRERVLHHAVMNICEPYLDAYAIADTYACRKGKGTRRALAKAQELTRQCPWYLKLDIRKYFDSVTHEILLRLLSRRFKDRDLLALFQRLLASYHTEPGRGLPIGNLISQHLANFYLGLLDHWVKEERRLKQYIRYMDDFVIGGETKERLAAELIAIRDFLRQRLGLELKGNIQLNRCHLGIPFLGYRVYPGTIRLAPRSRSRFVGTLRRYEELWQRGAWTSTKLAQRVEALVDFTKAADAKGFRVTVIARYGVPS